MKVLKPGKRLIPFKLNVICGAPIEPGVLVYGCGAELEIIQEDIFVLSIETPVRSYKCPRCHNINPLHNSLVPINLRNIPTYGLWLNQRKERLEKMLYENENDVSDKKILSHFYSSFPHKPNEILSYISKIFKSPIQE